MKPLEIAKNINRQLKVDVFRNTRKQETVEARSLLCYILRNKLRLRWTNIALFFRNNGKSMIIIFSKRDGLIVLHGQPYQKIQIVLHRQIASIA